MPPVQPISLRQTFSDIRSDYRRLAKALGVRMSISRVIFSTISPPVLALILYRLSHYLYVKGLRPVSWLVYCANYYITGADITPSTIIGHSCLIGHATGVTLACRLGNNVTLYGRNGVGGGRREGDIGGGPGLPVVEDDVTLGWGSSVLGAIRIGRGTTVGAHVLVIDDVPPDSIVVSSARALVRARGAGKSGLTAADDDLVGAH